MDDELRRKDIDALCSAEETCHLMAVLCTDPLLRRSYEQRLDAIRQELERRAGRSGR